MAAGKSGNPRSDASSSTRSVPMTAKAWRSASSHASRSSNNNRAAWSSCAKLGASRSPAPKRIAVVTSAGRGGRSSSHTGGEVIQARTGTGMRGRCSSAATAGGMITRPQSVGKLPYHLILFPMVVSNSLSTLCGRGRKVWYSLSALPLRHSGCGIGIVVRMHSTAWVFELSQW